MWSPDVSVAVVRYEAVPRGGQPGFPVIEFLTLRGPEVRRVSHEEQLTAIVMGMGSEELSLQTVVEGHREHRRKVGVRGNGLLEESSLSPDGLASFQFRKDGDGRLRVWHGGLPMWTNRPVDQEFGKPIVIEPTKGIGPHQVLFYLLLSELGGVRVTASPKVRKELSGALFSHNLA